MSDDKHELSEKKKWYIIDLNDPEPPDNPVEPVEPKQEPKPDGDKFLLGMEIFRQIGDPVKFVMNLADEDDGDFLLLQPDEEQDYRNALPWLSLLSLAGARTFTNAEKSVIFADPQESWAAFYFERIAASLANAEYGQLIWRQYSSIDLWLKEAASGEVLASLRLAAPDPDGNPGY